MRDIKFRVWDGNKIHYPAVCEIGVCGVNGKTSASFQSDGGYLTSAYVMQFTGLLDKAGVEIYEGDIVKIKTQFRDDEVDKTCVTVMDGWQSVFEAARNTEDGFYCPMGSTAQNDREVIGNIYEHSHLLEG